MDNHLNDKYRHDRLTPAELTAWKKQVAAMEEHEMKQLIAPRGSTKSRPKRLSPTTA